MMDDGCENEACGLELEARRKINEQVFGKVSYSILFMHSFILQICGGQV
jgi:hypothetical protein